LGMSRRELFEGFLGLLRNRNDRTEVKRICFSGCEAFSLQPQSANCNETTATSVLARNEHAFPHCACPLRRAKRIRQSPEFPNSVKHFTLSDWWWRYHGAEPEGCIDADT
jgi:hypothetical protein